MLPSIAELEKLYHRARAIAVLSERQAWLNESCPDGATRSRVEAMLRVDPAFLAVPSPDVAAFLESSRGNVAGSTIGSYRLLEQIGEGGFGIVFMAEQQQPVRRKVALKILKPGMDTRQIVARFEAERQALALMDHPNIATVFDGGTGPDGRPYFVMELVRGSAITDYCDRERMSVRERLALLIDVCLAVQHAHQKGIIHRDLKPSNILVTQHDGTPVVKVIDFGVAKAIGESLTDKTLFTQFAQLVGTPLYMSPEQMALSGLDVDTRADVYALGVLIYELLTGTTPFRRERFRDADFDEFRRAVREEEPDRPSRRIPTLQDSATVTDARRCDPRQLSRMLRGELDWIAMKCLEKDRTRRYAGAGDLARDLQRYLSDEPIEARPPSAAYRMSKFVRRHRGAVAAAAVVSLALLGGIVGTSWGLMQASRRAEAESRQRERAEAAEQSAREKETAALDQLALSRALTEFLQHDLLGQAGSKSQANRKQEPQPNLSVREALDRAAATLGERFRDRPELEAGIRHTIGSMHRELGEPRKAVVQLQHAAEISRECRGAGHRDTLAVQHDLAGAMRESGQLAEAAVLFQSVLDRRAEVLGPDHADTVNTMNSLALSWRAVGQFQKSTALLEDVLVRRTRLFGPEDPRTLTTLDNLGTAALYAGNPAKAIAMLKTAADTRARVLSPDHPDTLHSLSNLASAHLEANEIGAADAILEPLYATSVRVMSAPHPLSLNILNKRATIQSKLGRSEEAMKLLEELQTQYAMQGGPDHIEALQAKKSIAVILNGKGQSTRAITMLEEVLQAERRTLPDTHYNTIGTAGHLGTMYRDAGRLDDAYPLLESAHRRSRGYGNLKWIGANLLSAYIRGGKRASAIALTLELIERDRESLSAGGLPLAATLTRHGFTLMTLKAWPEAEAAMKEAYEIRRKSEADVWTTFNTQSMLGEAILEQMRFDEAEPLLTQGYEGMLNRLKAVPKEARPRVVEGLRRLVRYHELRGEPAEVERRKAELAELVDRLKR